MLGKFIGAAGVAIAVIGVIHLIRLLMLQKTGVLTEVEVVSARERRPNSYVHTLRFPDGSEREDRSGFNRPFSTGERKIVVCDRKNLERFEYEDELKKNTIIVCALIGMAILFAIRGFLL